MENKETWINKTLESFNDFQSAEVSPQLADRLYKATLVKKDIRTIGPMVKWAVAASIILLAGLNVASIINFRKPSGAEIANPVYNEYFSYLSEF